MKPPTQESVTVPGDKMEPIAIVGISARLPQDVTSEESFWKLLSEGRSARTVVPKDRFDIDSFYHPDPDRLDATNVKYGHFVTGDVGAFDAPFFSIQPAEAMSMDPQQRCILEASYRALENAGMPMEAVAGSRTSVYVGASSRDYEFLLLRDLDQPGKYVGTGIGTSLLANRVSWFFNFKAPSITLDTACSSSLSALHLACQSLRSHESDMSLVGGCNLILAPDTSMVHLSNLGFFSPEGICYAFDSRANGYAKGEGVGMVTIKRLSDAVRDGDTIRAVIRATASNQDGRTPGITQPSKQAQTDNIRDAYEAGGLDLETTGFFEAHGTGTQIGDVLEAGAIQSTFQRGKDDPLLVGALKSNIGHLEAGSGIAALIKSVLVLEHGIIPPNVWYEKPNPSIPLDEWGLKFPTEATPWPTDGLRRLSLNSFGYGGSNAHLVLDDAFHYLQLRGISASHHTTVRVSAKVDSLVSEASSPINGHTNGDTRILYPHKRPRVFVWSASDEAGTTRTASAYQDHLSTLLSTHAGDKDDYLDNLAFTLSNKRSNLPWKSFLVAESIEDLHQNLFSTISKPIRSSKPPGLGFVFTGQGAQWHAMGRELTSYPAYKSSLQQSDSILKNIGCEWSLFDELYKDKDLSQVDDPALAQPLCTALQIALVDLFASWNIHPSAVVGHSSGEIAAAYCAGALSFESALKTSYFRGKLTSNLTKSSPRDGAMTSIALSEHDAVPYLDQAAAGLANGILSVGCVNSAKNITVTGDRCLVEALNRMMDAKGIFARKLAITVAYHSAHMEDIASEYLALLGTLSKKTEQSKSGNAAEQCPMFSSVTGTQISPGHLCRADYWVENMVSKVRFSEAFSLMSSFLSKQKPAGTKDHILEIGPQAALQRPIKENLRETNQVGGFDYDSVLSRGVSALQSCLEVMGRLRCKNHQLDLSVINSPNSRSSKPQLLVDLPEYPFNHSQTYWQESRLSRSHRLRTHGRHELLGSRSADWNPLEPKWKNIIRRSEHSWVPHHKINGSELYPAAGMIVMVIEGARQIANPALRVSNFHIKDMSFRRALMIDTAPDGLETQLSFYPQKNKAPLEINDFTLHAWLNGECVEICQGSITTEYANLGDELGNSQQTIPGHLHLEQRFDEGAKRCQEKVGSTQFYENLAAIGYEYGPTFQRLRSLQYCDTGEVICAINADDWNGETDCKALADHVVHPTTLDAVLQVALAAISGGSWTKITTMVPTQIRSLWISHDLLNRRKKQSLNAYGKTTFTGFREADFLVSIRDDGGDPRILVEGLRITAADSLGPTEQKTEVKRLCYSPDWKPDLDLLSNGQIAALMEQSVPLINSPNMNDIDRQELVSLYYMSFAMKYLESAEIELEKMPIHLRKYVDWMKYRFSQDMLDSLLTNSPELADSARQGDFLKDYASSSPEGKLTVQTGKNLIPILTGQLDALDLLFGGHLAANYYHSPTFKISYRKIATYLDCLSHKNPALRILEVGAGTGAGTVPIVDALTSYGKESNHPRFAKYTYTDISPAFFEEAKSRFAASSSRMEFKVLDIEKESQEQGFELHQYDVVVCGLVLHATADLSKTLGNVRSLLKPGGKLVLFEATKPTAVRLSFIFGLLPGWWLGSEKKRALGPLLPDADWHGLLTDNGFSGADVVIKDSKEPGKQTFSIILSTAQEDDRRAEIEQGRKTLIVAAEGSSAQEQIALGVEKALKSAGLLPCEVITMQDLRLCELKNSLCVFLEEVETPLLNHIGHDDFESLKRVFQSADGVLWVTQGCGEAATRPDFGTVTGLGRNILSENLNTPFVELSIELHTPIPQMVSQIMTVYQKCLISLDEARETEIREKDGQLHISRVVEANSLNHDLHGKLVRRQPEMQTFAQPGRALKLTIASVGLLDTLQFEDDDKYDLPLGDTEVEIQARAAGLNFSDITIVSGKLPGNALGFECSGIVSRVGANAGYATGDKVTSCATYGAYQTFVRADTTCVAKIPENMSFTTAAAIPAVYCTAYYGLVTLGKLQQGESVLIHSGAGGVGQAAIQIAKLLKANIFTTVGSKEKKKLVMELYGIPEDHVFSSRNTSFAQTIMNMTGGVDVILNSLSGEGLRASWSCIGLFGRFIEIGKADINSREGLPMFAFSRNATFAALDLRLVIAKQKAVMGEVMSAVMALFRGSQPLTTPQPLQIFDISKIEDAFRLMQSGKSSGKIVVEMCDDAIIPIIPSMKSTYKFESNATYVISGGLGGLGLSIIRWMMDRNARNFLVLSRSGASSSGAQELLEEVKESEVTINAPCCDISDEEAVVSALKQYEHSMPSIRGCIQGSMVLKEGLFQNLTSEDWNAGLQAKVQGSWILHKHLPRDLSFFILLSSLASVIGTPGQASYTAANTYQDALARHRVSRGEKSFSVNLGPIMGVGIAAERNVYDMMKKYGLQPIRKTEMFAVLDYCCDPSLAIPSPSESQIIMGAGEMEHLAPEKLKEIYWTRKPLFSVLRQFNATDAAVEPDSQDSFNAAKLLEAAATPEAAARIIVEALVSKLAKVLSSPIADVDAAKPIHAFGVDSLVALEIRYWFMKEVRADLSVFEIMGKESLYSLSELAAGKSEARKKEKMAS